MHFIVTQLRVVKCTLRHCFVGITILNNASYVIVSSMILLYYSIVGGLSGMSVHPSCKTIAKSFLFVFCLFCFCLFFFFFFFFFWGGGEEGGLSAIRTRAFSVEEKYLMPYSIISQCLYCFRHRGCWDCRLFGPYFSSLLANLQCSIRQGPCLLQMSTTRPPYVSEFYGDVLHEGIIGMFENFSAMKQVKVEKHVQ